MNLQNEALLQTLAANVRLLRGMTRTQLVSLLNLAEKYPANGGHVFFEEGETGASFHILISGTAAVCTRRDGKRVDLARLKSGDSFGEMCLVGRKTRSATVRALENTLSLRFQRERVEALPELAAVLYRNIATVMVNRLVDSNDKIGALMLQTDTASSDPHIYGLQPVTAIGHRAMRDSAPAAPSEATREPPGTP